MSISVDINIGTAQMEFTRDTVVTRSFRDNDASQFRHAADVLEEIAADIRRMYPGTETVQERGWGAPREDLDTRPLPAWYRTDTPHSKHPHNERSECLPDKESDQ